MQRGPNPTHQPQCILIDIDGGGKPLTSVPSIVSSTATVTKNDLVFVEPGSEAESDDKGKKPAATAAPTVRL